MPTRLEIRKAFERTLRDACDAQYGAGWSDSHISWPNMGFDDSALDRYLRPTLHGPVNLPRTLGPTPAVSRKGFFKVGCFVKAGSRADPLDSLADLVVAAYPYGVDLVAGGAQIQIDQVTVGDLLTPPGWAYEPVDINWSINI
jgi:hypothetical protein